MNYIFLCCFLFSAVVLSTHAVQGNSITTELPPANTSSSHHNTTKTHPLKVFSPLAALRSFFTAKSVSSNATNANNATNATVHSVSRRDLDVLNASLSNDSHNKSESATIESRTLESNFDNITITFNSKLPIQDMLPRDAGNSSDTANSTNESLGRASTIEVQLHETKQNSTESPKESSKKARRQADGDDDDEDDGEGRRYNQRPYPPPRPYKQEHVRPYTPPLPQRPYPQPEICHSSQPCPCGMNQCKMPCRNLIYNAPLEKY